MGYANDITGLCEDAAQAYIRVSKPGRIPSGSIFTGLDSELLLLPRAVCLCNKAEQILFPEGCWDAELQIYVRSNADDTPRQKHRDTAGEIFALFMGAPLVAADALSVQPGFTAQFIVPKSQGWDLVAGEKNRSWRSWMTFSVKCNGSDLV